MGQFYCCEHLVAKPQVYRWRLPSCCPFMICLAYPASHLTFTTRLLPPHSLWSHTGAAHLTCPLDASLLRVSVFTSLLSPWLWKQVTGSIHAFQTRSYQGFLQPSWCFFNHSSTLVLLLCIILSSFLIRPPTFAGVTEGISGGYLTV